MPTGFFNLHPNGLFVGREDHHFSQDFLFHTWMSQEVRINGLFHRLINGVYWGYNPLILTFDHPSNHGSMQNKALKQDGGPPFSTEPWWLAKKKTYQVFSGPLIHIAPLDLPPFTPVALRSGRLGKRWCHSDRSTMGDERKGKSQSPLLLLIIIIIKYLIILF